MDKTMMSCKDKNIKELLPAYLEQGLDRAEAIRVEAHLKTCKDCRTELTLLRAMVDEPVPDPGNVFWAEMPARIYRQVQKQKVLEREQRWPGLSGIMERITMPRWAWTAAAVGVILAISWLSFYSVRDREVAKTAVSSGDEAPYEDILSVDPVDVAGLDPSELENLATWVNSGLAAIGDETRSVAANSTETGIEEELAELNSKEIRKLSTMLEKWKPEV
jgi:anti-sigma factor RsiW